MENLAIKYCPILSFQRFLVILYPYHQVRRSNLHLMKRFTYWPLFFFGITFNYGLILGWTSITNEISIAPIIFYIGAIFFSLIFYFIIGDGQYNTVSHPASQFIFREWFLNFKSNILWMAATGVTATLAFLLLFTAYSIASPSVISPFEYSILLWSPLIGWLYFQEIPNLNTIIGILIIVSSGIYIFMREKAQEQLIATEKPLR